MGLQESIQDLEANERTSLMGNGGPSAYDAASTDAFFIPLLDRELKKICIFYEMEEQRLSDDAATLQQEIERQEENGPYAGHQYLDEDGDDDDEEDVKALLRVLARAAKVIFMSRSPVHKRKDEVKKGEDKESRWERKLEPESSSGASATVWE